MCDQIRVGSIVRENVRGADGEFVSTHALEVIGSKVSKGRTILTCTWVDEEGLHKGEFDLANVRAVPVGGSD